MHDILFEYELNPTTWAYLAALLTIGIYFKFNRLFSLRNLDLLGLIFFSPAFLMVFHGSVKQLPGVVHFGYAWLFGVGALFLVRLLLDPLMVRRPLLEPNLSAGGLTFTGVAILLFFAANVVSNRPPARLEHVLARDNAWGLRSPGNAFFQFVASFPNTVPAEGLPVPPQAEWSYPPTHVQVGIARAGVMLAQLAVVLGIVAIGYYHFDNFQTGVAAAVLYLLSPYIGQMGGRLDHAVPGALLVWAMVAYRRPLISALLVGLAGGLVFYPLFLLPLGLSYYWRRGLTRYLVGSLLGIGLAILVVALASDSLEMFRRLLGQMFGMTILARETAVGFWEAYQPAYRIPVLAIFVVLSTSLALWPPQKNFGTLLSCSASVMLASQFCQAFEGGLCMGWYLPLLLLTSFRPNLEDRVALGAVIERHAGWMAWLVHRFRPAKGPSSG